MSEDKKHTEIHQQGENDPSHFLDLEGICAPGMIDPLLDKPLWQTHKYAKLDNWKSLYCPTHDVIYKRLEQMKKLNSIDGQ